MKRYITFFNAFRHEALAAVFALSTMTLVLQLLLATGGTASSATATPEANIRAPLLGVNATEANAPDQLARAAETQKTPKFQPEPLEPPKVKETAAGAPPIDKNNVEAEIASDTTSEAANAVSDPKAATGHQPDKETSTQAETNSLTFVEPTPQPNTVEETPKLVKEMSAAEIQEAIDAYMAWIHEGEVTLKLDLSELSPQQLNSISAGYLLTKARDRYDFSPSRTLGIDGAGRSHILEESEYPLQKWISDLPVNSSRWPQNVASGATKAFGQYYKLEGANFILSDEIALKLFRFLARSVGNREPQPGAVFVLRLVPSAQNQIQVELAN